MRRPAQHSVKHLRIIIPYPLSKYSPNCSAADKYIGNNAQSSEENSYLTNLDYIFTLSFTNRFSNAIAHGRSATIMCAEGPFSKTANIRSSRVQLLEEIAIVKNRKCHSGQMRQYPQAMIKRVGTGGLFQSRPDELQAGLLWAVGPEIGGHRGHFRNSITGFVSRSNSDVSSQLNTARPPCYRMEVNVRAG